MGTDAASVYFKNSTAESVQRITFTEWSVCAVLKCWNLYCDYIPKLSENRTLMFHILWTLQNGLSHSTEPMISGGAERYKLTAAQSAAQETFLTLYWKGYKKKKSICLNLCIDSLCAKDAGFWRCSGYLLRVNVVGVVHMLVSLVELSALNCFFKELLQAALLQPAHFLHVLLAESARRLCKWKYQLWLPVRNDTPNKDYIGTTTETGVQWDRQNKCPDYSNYNSRSTLKQDWVQEIRQSGDKSFITRP